MSCERERKAIKWPWEFLYFNCHKRFRTFSPTTFLKLELDYTCGLLLSKTEEGSLKETKTQKLIAPQTLKMSEREMRYGAKENKYSLSQLCWHNYSCFTRAKNISVNNIFNKSVFVANNDKKSFNIQREMLKIQFWKTWTHLCIWKI